MANQSTSHVGQNAAPLTFSKLLPWLRARRVLWYPSAGGDFRPLLHCHPLLAPERGMPAGEVPEVFLFSDADPTSFLRGAGEALSADPARTLTTCLPLKLHDDGRTELVLESADAVRFDLPITLADPKGFYIQPSAVATVPTAWRLGLRITSTRLGVIPATVFYFSFENTCFLREILLRYEVGVHTLHHVKDGSGFGGSCVPFRWLYLYFHHLQTRYLITDRVQSSSEVMEYSDPGIFPSDESQPEFPRAVRELLTTVELKPGWGWRSEEELQRLEELAAEEDEEEERPRPRRRFGNRGPGSRPRRWYRHRYGIKPGSVHVRQVGCNQIAGNYRSRRELHWFKLHDRTAPAAEEYDPEED